MSSTVSAEKQPKKPKRNLTPLFPKTKAIATTSLPADRQSAPDAVLERLSDRFEYASTGLGEVHKQWEEREGESDGSLLLG